jgi:hypothetical protein
VSRFELTDDRRISVSVSMGSVKRINGQCDEEEEKP